MDGEKKLLIPASGSRGQSCRMCLNCDNFSIFGLKSFQFAWKLLKLSGNFLGCLESFQVVWKHSKLSGNFSGCLDKKLEKCGEK